ncbi:deoxycytidine triphosphate deaminase [Staphylococcus gallinarum]|uniref:Deoxycytidine triphosphate deaminase n=1 Tax=Staphylococcus gallinarum TaxID=1293 RepID=A0A380FBC7_STAGA|nr:deoxycytidine triphosphate deaminase [Staphylococcus gallinarum]
MILSDTDIKQFLQQGKIEITPLQTHHIESASIDLTLGNHLPVSTTTSRFKTKYFGTRLL